MAMLVAGVVVMLAGCNNTPHCGCSGPACSCSGSPVLSLPDGGDPAAVTLISTGSGSSGFYALDFGPAAVGGQSDVDLLLANDGPCALQIVSVGAPSDPEFTLQLAVGTTLDRCEHPDAGSVEVPATFKPSSSGPKSGTLAIQTDSQVIPTITLTFTGTGM
jgi:hypothetical protein